MHRYARVLALGASFLAPVAASAHAFGQQYTLQLPINYYIFGGSVAFIASACIILLFSEPRREPVPGPRLVPYRHPRRARLAFKLAGLAALITELILCIAGPVDYFANPAIVLFWVYLLLGLTYLSVFIGGIFELANPFKTLAELLTPAEGLSYPAWLQYWPAILLFFGLIELELYSGGAASDPLSLGLILIAYLAVMLVGSAVYGAEAWVAHADMFGIFFSTVSRFAPLTLTANGLEVAPPGAGLLRERPEHPTLVLFILFMLSSTAFDGVHETRAWYTVLGWLHELGLPFIPGIVGTAGLALSPFIFFGAFAFAAWLMRAAARGAHSLSYYVLRFGYSLVPIAIAYHFAHYFTLLLGEGQRLFYQISDPLGLGWDIFGTASYSPNFVPIGAGTVWYIQLGVIVVGHVIAALIAHRIAVREFPNASTVIKSQFPMLVLMVGYTALGLWILSRPFAV